MVLEVAILAVLYVQYTFQDNNITQDNSSREPSNIYDHRPEGRLL